MVISFSRGLFGGFGFLFYNGSCPELGGNGKETKMEKPGVKFVVVFNLVMNLPMAIAMAVSAGLLSGGIQMPGIFINILIGFAVACLISVLLPIQRIGAWFAGLFRLDDHSLAGAMVSNLLVAFIFNVIVGFVLTWVNAGIFGHQPMRVVFEAFLGTFLPLYVVLYIVSFIMQPIAFKVASGIVAKK